MLTDLCFPSCETARQFLNSLTSMRAVQKQVVHSLMRLPQVGDLECEHLFPPHGITPSRTALSEVKLPCASCQLREDVVPAHERRRI